MDVKPFRFTIRSGKRYPLCSAYPCMSAAQVTVRSSVWGASSTAVVHLCRVCLVRMRATLKDAEKALPKPPKKVRPE